MIRGESTNTVRANRNGEEVKDWALGHPEVYRTGRRGGNSKRSWEVVRKTEERPGACGALETKIGEYLLEQRERFCQMLEIGQKMRTQKWQLGLTHDKHRWPEGRSFSGPVGAKTLLRRVQESLGEEREAAGMYNPLSRRVLGYSSLPNVTIEAWKEKGL